MRDPKTADGRWRLVADQHCTRDLQIFLETCGLDLFPVESDDDLPTYDIGFRDPDGDTFEERSFDHLLRIIERITELFSDLSKVRERAIAAADATGPHADRRMISAAAGMSPPTIYAILKRNGRPSNRRETRG
jgi:hypothetical protein